jgi:hypothetical protein
MRVRHLIALWAAFVGAAIAVNTGASATNSYAVSAATATGTVTCDTATLDVVGATPGLTVIVGVGAEPPMGLVIDINGNGHGTFNTSFEAQHGEVRVFADEVSMNTHLFDVTVTCANPEPPQYLDPTAVAVAEPAAPAAPSAVHVELKKVAERWNSVALAPPW